MARREITGHETPDSEFTVQVFAIDEPHENGASHQYRIARDDGASVQLVHFHEGEFDWRSNDVNGATDEAILAILADRMRGFQTGPKACKGYATALRKIEESMEALRKKGKKKEENLVDAPAMT